MAGMDIEHSIGSGNRWWYQKSMQHSGEEKLAAGDTP